MSWKPMSEAPRDGTCILVRRKEEEVKFCGVFSFFRGRWVNQHLFRVFTEQVEDRYVFTEIPEAE